jgi:CRP/FNR family transcriptional regulator, cyclic AMP receptor protein
VRLSRRRKTDLLKAIPLFAECSRKELEAVAFVADEVMLPTGTVLMKEGAVGRELVVIVEGQVDVVQGGNRIATLSSAGDFVGELALVTHRPRSATVTAATELRALVLTARDFEHILSDVPTIAVKVVRAIGERLGPEPH